MIDIALSQCDEVLVISSFRQCQHELSLRELDARGMVFTLLRGAFEQRLATAAEAL